MYKLKREQFIPVTIDKAWEFFSTPNNLARISPPDMEFKIVSGVGEPSLKEGQEFEYIVRPFLRIPMRWKSKIQDVMKPDYFTDVQLSGPYSVWEHSHRFIAVDGGVRMIDEVNYQLPAGILGRIMHSLFIKKRLEYIFDYRYITLEKIFK